MLIRDRHVCTPKILILIGDLILSLCQSPTQLIPYFKVFVMNGCFNASAGVILFSGLSAKQRSNRSRNNSSSLISGSLKPLDADMRRVRRSRDGLLNARVLMVSCNRNHVSETSSMHLDASWKGQHVMLWGRCSGQVTALSLAARAPQRFIFGGHHDGNRHTFPVSLSCSTLLKLAISSKWM